MTNCTLLRGCNKLSSVINYRSMVVPRVQPHRPPAEPKSSKCSLEWNDIATLLWAVNNTYGQFFFYESKTLLPIPRRDTDRSCWRLGRLSRTTSRTWKITFISLPILNASPSSSRLMPAVVNSSICYICAYNYRAVRSAKSKQQRTIVSIVKNTSSHSPQIERNWVRKPKVLPGTLYLITWPFHICHQHCVDWDFKIIIPSVTL